MEGASGAEELNGSRADRERNARMIRLDISRKARAACRKAVMIAAFTCLLGAAPTEAGPFEVDPKKFWREAPLAPKDLPADRLYPAGRKFLFTFYSVGGGIDSARPLREAEVQKIFSDYRKHGFEIIGPQYEMSPRALKDAAVHDFQVVQSVGLSKDEVKRSKPGEEPSLEECRQQIIAQVKAVADDPKIILWDLKPEELRPWRKREIAYLAMASEAIRDADPLKRPIYHYAPGHFTAKQLQSLAPHVDILGKGMYVNYSSQKQSRIWCKWTIDQEIEAIRASDSKAIPVAVTEMFQQPEANELELIPSWVRHDVYLSMVSGAKGVIVFSMRKRENFEAWQAYYDAYQKVAAELLGEGGLAEAFLFGERREDLRVEITEGPETVEMTFRQADVKEPIRYPSVHTAELVYGKKRYFVAVNSSNETVKAMVVGFPYDSAQALASDEKVPVPIAEGEFSATFAPLETKIWRISQK